MFPENKRILVVIRTYPTPAQKGIEVSCTAGVTDDGKWIRLFPVPYRLLQPQQRFSKYQWIEVDVMKASDPRPESYHISVDSLTIVSGVLPTENEWQSRKAIIEPLKAHCLCCLKAERDKNLSPTLGFFKPKVIRRLLIEPDDPDWTQEQKDRLGQLDMYRQAPAEELEKIPNTFTYDFFCEESECTGHALMCTDWEMLESWRRWKEDYSGSWEAKFRERYERDMIQMKDTHFFVGTHSSHPQEWLIVGLFYPPKLPSLPLFNGITS
jgi:hypothetical protein